MLFRQHGEKIDFVNLFVRTITSTPLRKLSTPLRNGVTVLLKGKIRYEVFAIKYKYILVFTYNTTERKLNCVEIYIFIVRFRPQNL